MSFAEWKKKTKLLNDVNWAHRMDAERAAKAAYKAGERQGRKDAEDWHNRMTIANRKELNDNY